MAISICLSVCLSPEMRTCRPMAWLACLAQQRNSAGDCERPQRCWASQASGQHSDGSGGLSCRPFGPYWLVLHTCQWHSTVFTEICGYDNLMLSEQHEEENAASKKWCTAALVNSRRNEDTIARIYSRHQNINNNSNIRPCKPQDTNNWDCVRTSCR